LGVVDVLESGELLVELRDGRGGRLGREPAFQGLMEPLDLPLGLRVCGGAVLLRDVEAGQEVLEPVRAADAVRESGGVDQSVVGEGGRGEPVLCGRGGEGGDDDRGVDAGVRGDVQQESGVVIEPGDDLRVGVVGEGPVREVGLPGLVGLCRFESDDR
jgi:hypothetical protein